MIDLQDVLAARDRIRGIVAVTPCPLSEPFSELCGARIHFKLENLHRTGSFKERGAANKFALLTADERKRGVVAASAGNHAQGVAINAQRLGIQATIVMPETAPLSKVEATRKLGAHIVLSGNNYDDAYAEARRLQQERGFVFIHAFDDDAIIAGQGTAAFEILEQVPDVEVLVASIGGGGWLGGMALAMKSLKPSVRVVGVESSHLPKMRAALDAGGPIVIPNATTLADGIAVKRAGERTLPLIRKYVDELVGVDDEEVANAILALIEREKTVAEGAGAASAAALLQHKIKGLKPATKVVCTISGGNIDPNLISRIIERGLVVEGRRVMIAVRVPDRPGGLAELLNLVALARANLVTLEHVREAVALRVRETGVELTLETRGPDHTQQVLAALAEAGYQVSLE